LLALGVRPDIVIGDLDSMPLEAERRLAEQGTSFIRRPRAKDETDLELALLYAVDHYSGEIVVLGALGGRLDQTLANILLLVHPVLEDRPVTLVTAFQRAWVIRDTGRIQGVSGDRVSLIPLGGDVLIAETAGLAWPLHGESLVFGPARGVSNVLTAAEATVTVQAGQLLCVHISQAWER
jgi:thiamine pyrophosphokinase